MQDRYVADIGDYVKLGLLRALAEGSRLGVAWYLFPNESHNSDGKHITYLRSRELWRSHDDELFDTLSTLVTQRTRSISSLESSRVLSNAIYANEPLQSDIVSSAERAQWRKGWFDRVVTNLASCDIVFADPDNGLCLDSRFSEWQRKDWKRLPLSEAYSLAENRTAIFYHHNSRYTGGHSAEIRYWLSQFNSETLALYWGGKGSMSPRTFFVVNPSEEISKKLAEFCKVWKQATILK